MQRDIWVVPCGFRFVSKRIRVLCDLVNVSRLLRGFEQRYGEGGGGGGAERSTTDAVRFSIISPSTRDLRYR